jgi:hypothetical protein
MNRPGASRMANNGPTSVIGSCIGFDRVSGKKVDPAYTAVSRVEVWSGLTSA